MGKSRLMESGPNKGQLLEESCRPLTFSRAISHISFQRPLEGHTSMKNNTNRLRTRAPARCKYPWSAICRMREMHRQGKSIREIAELFSINKHYLRQILHGESRPVEDSGARHQSPLSRPLGNPQEYIRSSDGLSWRKRGTRRRFQRVIPWDTIVRIRMERDTRRTPAGVLAARFGISPSYVKEIIARRVRVTE